MQVSFPLLSNARAIYIFLANAKCLYTATLKTSIVVSEVQFDKYHLLGAMIESFLHFISFCKNYTLFFLIKNSLKFKEMTKKERLTFCRQSRQ